MNLARTLIQTLKPYSPPLTGRTAFDGLLLDFNERSDSMQLKDKNHYPEYGELQKALAEYCKVDEDQTLLTNGSDQAIIDSGAGPEILRLLAQRIPEQ